MTGSCIPDPAQVTILARECGLQLELSDIPIESLVPENKTGSVGLKQYPRNHAFAQLEGSDNIISFQTSRYKRQPLFIRGPGAGADVTAGGVFSDLLKLAAYLGAPS
eukprot:1156449-Pelagomonas_calceolata.AAC.13